MKEQIITIVRTVSDDVSDADTQKGFLDMVQYQNGSVSVESKTVIEPISVVVTYYPEEDDALYDARTIEPAKMLLARLDDIILKYKDHSGLLGNLDVRLG